MLIADSQVGQQKDLMFLKVRMFYGRFVERLFTFFSRKMSDELALIADDLSVLRMVRNDDDDDPDARFEKLMDKLKMLQNLIQKAKAAGKNVSASVPDEITELKQAVMETTVVVDEAAQMFTNKETSLCKAQLKFAAPADE